MTVRYIHTQNVYPVKYNGFTIAYERNEESIVFAYALCHRNDLFVKKIGRQMSTATLESVAEIPDITHVDIVTRTGRIMLADVIGYAKQQYDIDNMLSDQLLGSMKMFDFKHVFLSNVVRDYVDGFIEV